MSFHMYVVAANSFRWSPKSTFVASDWRIAKQIAKELAAVGIFVSIDTQCRDVGIDYTAAKFRSTKTVKARLAKAKLRNSRIEGLAKITRFAKKPFCCRHLPARSVGPSVCRFCKFGSPLFKENVCCNMRHTACTEMSN